MRFHLLTPHFLRGPVAAETVASREAICYIGSSGLPGPPLGAVAQLGERFNGIEEVEGSSPSSSTTSDLTTLV